MFKSDICWRTNGRRANCFHRIIEDEEEISHRIVCIAFTSFNTRIEDLLYFIMRDLRFINEQSCWMWLLVFFARFEWVFERGFFVALCERMLRCKQCARYVNLGRFVVCFVFFLVRWTRRMTKMCIRRVVLCVFQWDLLTVELRIVSVCQSNYVQSLFGHFWG